ncbi:hypothetical protein IAR50_000152 [Cryptococcus sp. DSM 104548]
MYWDGVARDNNLEQPLGGSGMGSAGLQVVRLARGGDLDEDSRLRGGILKDGYYVWRYPTVFGAYLSVNVEDNVIMEMPMTMGTEDANLLKVNVYALLPPIGTPCPASGCYHMIPHSEAKYPSMAFKIPNADSPSSGYSHSIRLGKQGRLAAVWDWKKGICLGGIPVSPKSRDESPESGGYDDDRSEEDWDDDQTAPDHFIPMGPFAILDRVFQVSSDSFITSSETSPAARPYHMTVYALVPEPRGTLPSSCVHPTGAEKGNSYHLPRAIRQPSDIPWLTPFVRFALPLLAEGVEKDAAGSETVHVDTSRFELHSLPYSEACHNGDSLTLYSFGLGDSQKHLIKLNVLLKLSTEVLIDRARQALEGALLAPGHRIATTDMSKQAQSLSMVPSMTRVEQTRRAAEALACLNDGKVKDIRDGWKSLAMNAQAGTADENPLHLYADSVIPHHRLGDYPGSLVSSASARESTTAQTSSTPESCIAKLAVWRNSATPSLCLSFTTTTLKLPRMRRIWEVGIEVESERDCQKYLHDECGESERPSSLAWMAHRSALATLTAEPEDGGDSRDYEDSPPRMLFDGASVVLQGVIPGSLMFLTFEG